ncbi:MAG: dihydrolipoyl dehydrogenase family protein [Acidimicrobiales bacterium]
MTQEGYPGAADDMHSPGRSSFDLVVLGGGSAAEELCTALAEAGAGKPPLRVAVVEKDLVGGKCAFLACMPSKAMLRSAAARRLAGISAKLGAIVKDPVLEPSEEAFGLAVRRRDIVAEQRDDSDHAEELASLGVELFRGSGRITGPGELVVELTDGNACTIGWSTLVVATGSSPQAPRLDGLESAATWTSDEALASAELPGSLVILGGGPVGCELAEMYSAYGCQVSVVESADRLAAREEPEVSLALGDHLGGLGVSLHLGVKVEQVRADAGCSMLRLSDGTELGGEKIVLATGRRPVTDGLGLDSLGVEPDPRTGALKIDERCRVVGVDHLYAAGDVNGTAPFTHAAKYQARVIADNLLGGNRVVDPRAIPRCVYTDPPLAAVGMTTSSAAEQGLDFARARLDLAETARAQSDGRLVAAAGESHSTDSSLDPAATGTLVLLADRRRRVLVGASVFGPRADEWISELTLAIRAGIPIDLLAEVVHPFPTYAEAIEPAIRDLLGQCDR